MSHLHGRRRARRVSSAWLIVAAGALLLTLAAFLFMRQAGPSQGGTPQIEVDQPKIDYGYVKFGNNKQFTIKVTNAGDGTLRFTQKPYVEVLEGC